MTIIKQYAENMSFWQLTKNKLNQTSKRNTEEFKEVKIDNFS